MRQLQKTVTERRAATVESLQAFVLGAGEGDSRTGGGRGAGVGESSADAGRAAISDAARHVAKTSNVGEARCTLPR